MRDCLLKNYTLFILSSFLLFTQLNGQMDMHINPGFAKPWMNLWLTGNLLENKEMTALINKMDSAGIGGIRINTYPNVEVNNKHLQVINEYLQNDLIFSIPVLFDTTRLHGNGLPDNILARKMEIFKIDTFIPGNTIRATIDSLISPGDSLLGIFAVSSDFQNQTDILWLIDKPNYTEYFMPGKGWEIYLFLSKPDHQHIDFYNKQAVQNYLDSCFSPSHLTNPERIKLFANRNASLLKITWSSGFCSEFKNRRGYDIKPYLYLFINSFVSDIQSRVMSDYYLTLSELAIENYSGTLKTCSNKSGLAVQNDIANLPGNLLDLYAAGDIISESKTGRTGFTITGLRNDEAYVSGLMPMYYNFAVSSANTYGISFVSCEIGENMGFPLTVSLAQLKLEIDRLFIQGVNHVIYNGFANMSGSDLLPDTLFHKYALFNPDNSSWESIKDLSRYILRNQLILQNSLPDKDILLYFPVYDYLGDFTFTGELYAFNKDNFDQWFNNSPVGVLAYQLHFKGYEFDFISDRQLNSLKTSKNEIITGNSTYKILFIPECTFMPLETMNKIHELAENGVKVIFINGLPKDVPGFYKYETNRLKLLDLKYALFVNQNVSVVRDLNEAYGLEKIKKEELAFLQLNFTRKKYNKGSVYLISNLINQEIDEWVLLAEGSSNYVIYDAVTDLAGYAAKDYSNRVHIQVKPGQSLFIFSDYKDKNIGTWMYNDNKQVPVAIKGKWEVTFPGGVLRDTVVMYVPEFINQLWDEKFHYYSGKIKYTTSFELPGDYDINVNTLLSFTEVHEIAEIYINGNSLGKIWCLPYEVIMPPKTLKKKNNVLEVVVTNLSINKHIPDYSQYNLKPYDSGLSGLVKLVPLEY